MAHNNSLDELTLIIAVVHDVFIHMESEFDCKAKKNTVKKLTERFEAEGLSFLTKTLPRLGKALDKALSEAHPLDAVELRFEPQPNSKLPKLFGELFKRVLDNDGLPLPNPCVQCVLHLRQILYLFYKYKLPYTDDQEQAVLSKFVRTESELASISAYLRILGRACDEVAATDRVRQDRSVMSVTRKARMLLSSLFSNFDPRNIVPDHGPGAVATRQQLWEKWDWRNIAAKITERYPVDEYFHPNQTAVCDKYRQFSELTDKCLPARVLLVPKDSRGPRLISCEPVDFQWIQQGLHKALVSLIESHPLTRENVRFTDQVPNQMGALIGSATGRYATLDLNEASDRVALDLVRLLFPPHICEYLEACRTSSTRLPAGREIPLQKFAPMGSSLCFPILALSVWSILAAAAPDACVRNLGRPSEMAAFIHGTRHIYVYGDDVIVPQHYAEDAIEQLESFGLKVNRDKSCIKGSFRESCGMDAFKGTNVTPVRLRTVWSSSRSPDVLESWVAYANSFYERGYLITYEKIVGGLYQLFGPIPTKDKQLCCPSLYEAPDQEKLKSRRNPRNLQQERPQYYVWDVTSPVIHHHMDGWSMLHRWFNGVSDRISHVDPVTGRERLECFTPLEPFSSSTYTRRKTSILVKRWR